MNTVESLPINPTARRLQALAEIYRPGQASDVMNRTLGKLFAYETDACRAQLDQIRADLAVFEQQYGQSTDEFYKQFQAGQTDDRMDYVEWASLAQMATNLEEQLRVLIREQEA